MSFSPGGGTSNISTSGDVALSNPATNDVLTFESASGKWQNVPVAAATTSSTGTVKLAGDLAGSAASPQVAKVNGISVSGTPSTGYVLTATGTTAATWQAAASGGATIDAAALDIQPLGTQAAGAVGKAADAGHVHAMPTLNQVGLPTTSLAMNAKKITGLANGTVATDAAAFGQIPVAGTSSTTYAAGNDGRITGALQATNNLSDIGSATTARTNLGLGSAATQPSSAFDVAGAAAAVTTTSIGAIPTSQKAAASGVASLDTNTLVPKAQLGTGTANAVNALYGDGTWKPSTMYGWTNTKTGAYTAAIGDAVPCDASAGTFTVTLPASPPANTCVRIKKLDSSANAITVASSANIDGAASVQVTVQYTSQDFSYSGSTWYRV